MPVISNGVRDLSPVLFSKEHTIISFESARRASEWQYQFRHSRMLLARIQANSGLPR